MSRMYMGDKVSLLHGKFKAEFIKNSPINWSFYRQCKFTGIHNTRLIREKFTVGDREIFITAVNNSDMYNLMWTAINIACKWSTLSDAQETELADVIFSVVEYFNHTKFPDGKVVLAAQNHTAYDLFKVIMMVERDFAIRNNCTSIDTARKWGIGNFMNAIILEQCHELRDFILDHYETSFTLFGETILIADSWENGIHLYWDVIVYSHHQQLVRYMWRYPIEPAISTLLMLFVSRIEKVNIKCKMSRVFDDIDNGFTPYNIGIILDMARVTYDKMRKKTDAEIDFVDFVKHLALDILRHCTANQYHVFGSLVCDLWVKHKTVSDYNSTPVNFPKDVFKNCLDEPNNLFANHNQRFIVIRIPATSSIRFLGIAAYNCFQPETGYKKLMSGAIIIPTKDGGFEILSAKTKLNDLKTFKTYYECEEYAKELIRIAESDEKVEPITFAYCVRKFLNPTDGIADDYLIMDMLPLDIDFSWDGECLQCKDYTKLPNQMLYDDHKANGTPEWDVQRTFNTDATTNGGWI